MIKTTDPRRHMLPALFAWLCENFERVHLHAAVKCPGVVVPKAVATNVMPSQVMTATKDGDGHPEMIYVETVVLNFGLMATNSFYQNDKGFGAKMRFNGIATDVFLPFESIIAITSPDGNANQASAIFPLYYGQEVLNENYVAPQEQVKTEGSASAEESEKKPTTPRSHLRLVH
jgi:stringent starvation protein B